MSLFHSIIIHFQRKCNSIRKRVQFDKLLKFISNIYKRLIIVGALNDIPMIELLIKKIESKDRIKEKSLICICPASKIVIRCHYNVRISGVE